MKKRLLGILLCLCMVLTLFPALAFAEGGEGETSVCTCETACAAGAMNAECPVCGAEGAAPESCGKYTAPAEPTAVEQAQALIDALPAADTITAENRGGVETQLTAIDEAKAALTEEELAALDFTKYEAAIAALNALDGMGGAGTPLPADDTEELQKLLDAGGFVTLTKDYTITKTLEAPHVTLDLAGHVIRMNGSGSVLEVFGGLTLVDSDPYATHEDPSLPAGGVITGGKGADRGGGVLSRGRFTMTGGTIYNCEATRGGGVYVKEGTFTMNDGAIKGCSAQVAGGGVYAERAFIMNGGAIEDCSANYNGQAVYMKTYEFIANSGTIKGTVCVADNGRIATDAGTSYARFYDQVTIESGTISAGIYYGGIAPGPSVITESYHTVSFDLGGGSGDVPTQYFVNMTAYPALQPADPTRDGYTFTGWFSDEALATPYDFTGAVDKNITLYAGFKAATYTVTYDPGEYGTGSIPAGTKAHGKDFTLSADTFTRQGYVQYGWVTSDGMSYYPLGGTYSTDANVTLYPAWDKIEAMTVPFTTTVTLGSSGVPGETVFTLELVDANGKPVSNDAVAVSGSVTTNGAGSYNGALTLTGPVSQIQLFIMDEHDVFVRQVDAGAAGWTLDGTVWGVILDNVESDNTEGGVAFLLRIYPVKVVDGKYVLDSNAGPVERMTFSNFFTHTHRYSQCFNDTEHWDECPCGDEQNRAPHRFGDWVITSRPTGTATGLKERKCADCHYVQTAEIPKLSPTDSPGTGDTSKLALWLALLGASAAGLSAAAPFGRRRKGFRH